MPTYMPPSALFKRLTAYPPGTPQTASNGRVKPATTSDSENAVSMLGVVAESKQSEVDRYHQLDIRITHTIVERGHATADRGWTLAFGARKFRVKAMDNPGALNAYALYYCEEMMN
ncbi:MAG: hypothetical protein RR482_00905 [Clostridia bacterium]